MLHACRPRTRTACWRSAAALLIVLSIVVLVAQGGDLDAPAASALSAVAAGLAVAYARRRPVAAILGFSVALILAVVLGDALDEDNALLLIAYFLLPVSWAANTDHRTFVRTAPLVIVLFPLAVVIHEPSAAAGSLIFILLVPVGFGAAGGRLMAWHAEAARRLEQQARELDANREARAAAAVTSERARIARDLHDLIAHDVSVMVVQAQAAERVVLGGRDGAEHAIEQIETTGRDALTETRRLLGVLRQGDEELALRPQPSMRRIAALMDEMRGLGVETELDVEGPTETLSPGLDMAAYRILSDGLRSVVEHGGARHASARVRRSRTELELQLEADGVLSPAAFAGVRERTLLFGGSIVVDPHSDDRGGVLLIRLPLADTEPAR